MIKYKNLLVYYLKDYVQIKKNNRNRKQKYYSKPKCVKIFSFKDIVLGKNIANLLMESKN